MRFFSRFKKGGQDAKIGNIRPVEPCAYGYSHRSKLEFSVCAIIRKKEIAGELIHIKHEDSLIICGPAGHECSYKSKIEYIADFKCRDVKTGGLFWIEAKGFANDRWPRTKRLWRHYGPGPLEIYTGSYLRPVLEETLLP